MNYFIYTMIFLLSLSIIAKLNWIKKGNFPERNNFDETLDIFLNSLLVCWALYLIWG